MSNQLSWPSLRRSPCVLKYGGSRAGERLRGCVASQGDYWTREFLASAIAESSA
jgi:hypothetical protein